MLSSSRFLNTRNSGFPFNCLRNKDIDTGSLAEALSVNYNEDMQTKEFYRKKFGRIMDFINFSEVCRQCGVNPSNFYAFMAGNDSRLSSKKLESMNLFLEKVRENIA